MGSSSGTWTLLPMLAGPPAGPNNASPTRTIVAALGHGDLQVAAHAHRPLRQREAVRERTQRTEPRGRAASAAPWAPIAINPRTSSPRSVQPSTTEGAMPGTQPPCCAAPLTFTWTSTAAPGARRATSAASERRSMDCHRGTKGAICRTLFRCSRPMACQRGGAGRSARSSRASALAASSWGKLSPRSTSPASTAAARPRPAGPS